MAKTTAIMLTWNALEYIKLTINSLLSSDESYKLIIFDNGSDKRTINYLKSVALHRDNITLLLSDKNIGTQAARNVAMGYVNTEYICTLDSDLYFPSKWLTPMERMMDDASVGIVGPLKLSSNLLHPYLSSGNLKQHWLDSESKEAAPKDQLRFFAGLQSFDIFARDVTNTNRQLSAEIPIPHRSISMCTLLTRTSLFKDRQLNDPYYARLKYSTFEDMDYSWSVYSNNYKVIKCKDVYVHHFEHSSVDDNGVDINANQNNATVIYFVQKWEHLIIKWLKRSTKSEIESNEFILLLKKLIPNDLPPKLKPFVV